MTRKKLMKMHSQILDTESDNLGGDIGDKNRGRDKGGHGTSESWEGGTIPVTLPYETMKMDIVFGDNLYEDDELEISSSKV